MNQPKLVSPSAFCWNPSCTAYGKVDQGNIRRFGFTQKGTPRYQCRICDKTFVETIGTVFYGRHHTLATILECLALLAERHSLAASHRVKGIKEETIMDWSRLAADHVERIEALLLANFQLTRAQLDAMWTYVGHKGEKGARGYPDVPAPMATDGKGGYREALVATWGHVPEYCGHGRPPRCKQPQPNWHYLQVIKHRSGYASRA